MQYIKILLICCLITSPLSIQAAQKAVDLKQRIKSFTVPEEFKVDVWADTTQTKNPSFFYFDSKGRLLVTELYRIGYGVMDVRSFPKDVTVADIEIVTLDDRLAMYDKYLDKLPPNLHSGVSDKIRLLEDSNNDGKADKSTIFADGFNHVLDGLGAGVIERDGKVYYTNSPHLWMLEDTDNDGVAEQKTSLQTGFGTRVSFMGHDMHGLIWGPDGRLYWSLGDRGYDLTTKEGKVFREPNMGAVFRADPDGSNIEVFYTGLRNPQELVFDEYGNLFTADNDGDRSDTERVNHLIEGGDSGWHAGHQTIMSFTKKLDLRSFKYTGDNDIPVAWLTNDMSVPRNNKQPAYMLPGIGQLFRGPSGFTYNPSNYLGEQWRNTFFIAHYGGSPTGSYISTFKAKENGASFLASEQKTIIRNINVSDIDFGPDGRFYISEFNFGGWDNSNEGAIYALDLKDTPAAMAKQNTHYQTLLTDDYSTKSISELSHLLAIDHQRIRQQAQFELAKRGDQGFSAFSRIALDTSENSFSRIHSIWGLSQLVFNKTIKKQRLSQLISLLEDSNNQVRIQTARVLGDHQANMAEAALIAALQDQDDQVVMYAAIGLGKIGAIASVPYVIEKLETIGDKDLWLRHALVMALKGVDKKHWITHKNHPNNNVRIAVLLALRGLKDDQVAEFLHDKSLAIVDEAIIAIDDKSLVNVRGQVAALLNPERAADTPEQAYMHHRIINANFNQGQATNAQQLLQYASHKGLSNRLISEALAAIEGWNDLNPIDTITGLPSLANPNRADISLQVLKYIPTILENTHGKALVQAMRIAKQFKFELSESALSKIAADSSANDDIRVQALALLNERFKTNIIHISQGLLTDPSSAVKTAALATLIENNSQLGLNIMADYLSTDDPQLIKIALAQLSDNTNASIDGLLIKKLTTLLNGSSNHAITLELINAAEKNTNPQIATLLTAYSQKMQQADLLTQFAGTLAGGSVDTGKNLFYTSGAAQCIRCHVINGKGSTVGPDLSAIGKQYSADYLLQALIDPSAAIAPGFGSFTLTMKDGRVISGLFNAESDTTITLGKAEEALQVYKKSEIKEIQRPGSGMPPMNYILTKPQIRDLVAFLGTLKGSKQKSKTSH